jgi:phage gp29-like protein
MSQVDKIIAEHDRGDFSRSAVLVDELMTDDRIMGVTRQRVAALRSAPLKFVPTGETEKHAEVADMLGDRNGQPGLWREMIAPDAQAALMKWGWFLGLGLGEICWRRTPATWIPWLRVWHPQFVRWDSTKGRFIVQTLDGQVELPRPDEEPQGDGEWFLYCPYGVEDGWKDGLVRSIARKYISRNWAERDWDRHGEKLGLGILKATTPPNAKPEVAKRFFNELANLHNEPVVECPQGSEEGGKKTPGYDVDLIEATALTWQSFDKRKSGLDVDLAILVTGQNLMTQVDGGSFAAAGQHGLVRQDIAVSDAEIGPALGKQVISWYARWNYKDPSLAPIPTYQVLPQEDEKAEAETMKARAEAVEILKRVEPRVDVVAILEACETPLLTEEEGAKVGEEQARRAAEALAKAVGGGRPANDGPSKDEPADEKKPGEPGPGDEEADDEALPATEKAALAALSVLPRSASGAFEEPQLRLLEQVFTAPIMKQALERHRAKEEAAAAAAAKAAKNLPNGVVSRRTFAGLPIAIENPVGSIRQWKGHDGKAGATRMKHDYGFIEGHLSGDDEPLDCYLGPNPNATHVYNIHQLLAPDFKRWDEDKAMIGFDSEADARAAYAAHRDDGERAIDTVSVIPIERFKARLKRRKPDSTSKIRASQDLARSLMALTRDVAGRKKHAEYQEDVIAAGAAAAARALAPDLAALSQAIKAGTSWEDIRERLLDLCRGQDPARVAEVVKNYNVLARLSGMAAAIVEAKV